MYNRIMYSNSCWRVHKKSHQFFSLSYSANIPTEVRKTTSEIVGRERSLAALDPRAVVALDPTSSGSVAKDKDLSL